MELLLFVAVACFAGCSGGGGSGDEASAGAGAGNGSAGEAGSAGGSSHAGTAGSSEGGEPGSGASHAGGGASSAGGEAPMSGGGTPNAGGQPAAGCELEPAIVSCEVDAGGGVRTCTETAIEGTPADVTRSQCAGTVREGEHCPSGPNLVGYCKGGITTYYYAPPGNDVWSTLDQSCPVLMGVWCPG